MKTWKVLKYGEGFSASGVLMLNCPKCGVDAEMPYREVPGNPVIASNGLSLIFDRPGRKLPYAVLPREVKCRYCRSVYVAIEEVANG